MKFDTGYRLATMKEIFGIYPQRTPPRAGCRCLRGIKCCESFLQVYKTPVAQGPHQLHQAPPIENPHSRKNSPPLNISIKYRHIPAAVFQLRRQRNTQEGIFSDFLEDDNGPGKIPALAEYFTSDIHADNTPPDFTFLKGRHRFFIAKP